MAGGLETEFELLEVQHVQLAGGMAALLHILLYGTGANKLPHLEQPGIGLWTRPNTSFCRVACTSKGEVNLFLLANKFWYQLELEDLSMGGR